LIGLRSHEDARVRAFAQAGVRGLGMEDPTLATSLPDTHLASEVVRAYTQPLDFAAMPTLVRLVNADKLELREAARFAVQRFGKNAIWQVRQLYTEVTSQNPNRSWDAERTARELYAVLDRAETEEAAMLLKKGMSAQASGDFAAMKQHYDQLLARFPRYAGRASLAPGYAAFGEYFLTHERLQDARDAFERALRLAPDAPAAKLLRAKVAFADAEIAQTQGVVDLHGYDEALRHEPGLQSAVVAKERLTGVRAARERRNKRLAAGAAILLLLGLGAMLLRGPSVSDATEPSVT
jgi:tetratricopeptide (TPR) repeat protein